MSTENNKKILLFFDGTGNHPDINEYGEECPTNVFRLFETVGKQFCERSIINYPGTEPWPLQLPRFVWSLVFHTDNLFLSNDQEYFNGETSSLPIYIWYTAGVGVSAGNRLSGGAAGNGIQVKVRKGYENLLKHYNPGDEIYLIGFSRGAYTACLLADMVSKLKSGPYGIGEKTKDAKNEGPDQAYLRSEQAYDAYMKGSFSEISENSVYCLALWDTVSALKWDAAKLPKLKDQESTKLKVGKYAKKVFHALSIDELRDRFEPEIICTNEGSVSQVWFAGAHSNIGGGYSTNGLSDITLDWMVDQLASIGFVVPKEPLSLFPDALGVMRNEVREGRIFQWIGKPKPREVEKGSIIHPSVKERLESEEVSTLEQTHLRKKPYVVYQGADVDPKPEIVGIHPRDSYRLWKYVTWRRMNAIFGLIVSLCAVISLVLTYFNYWTLEQILFWCVLPPVYFWLDWFILCQRFTFEQKADIRHFHQLSRNIWLGLLTLLIVVFVVRQ